MSDIDLTVVTEHWYVEAYPADWDVRLVDDIADLHAVREAALAVARERGLDAVVSPSERSMQAAGYVRSFLGLPGIGYDTANALTNKFVMKQRLNAAGIATARHLLAPGPQDVADAGARLGWPVVVKPVLGAGGVHTLVLADAAEAAGFAQGETAAALRARGVPLIVEALVPMDAEYHCDGVVVDGRVAFASVSRYLMPLLGQTDAFTGSYVLPAGSPALEPISELHQRSVTALGLRDGVTHLELFGTADGFLVGEMAGRPGGGGTVRTVRLQHGVDLWECFLATSLGRPPGLDPHRENGVFVNCDLPIRPGRILGLSSAEDFARVPGVVDVSMLRRPGDVVRTRIDSSAATGIVYLRVPDERDVAPRVREISECFTLEVEAAAPASEAAPAAPAAAAAVAPELSAVTHVMVGFSAGLVRDLDELLPAASLLVIEEPDVVAARNALTRCRASRCFGALIEAPIHDEAHVLDAVLALPGLPAVEVVVPGVEYGVAGAAALAEHLGLPGAGVSAAAILRDKALLRRAAGRLGVRQPAWFEAEDLAGADKAREMLGGRCVVKPANRQGSLGVTLLDAEDALEPAWRHVTGADEPRMRARRPLPTRYLVEERLDGPEVSVECLVAERRIRFLNVTAKTLFPGPFPVEAGHLVPAPLPAEVGRSLAEAMRALIEATGFRTGILHAEWILGPDGPGLVECAGRIPGDGIDTLIDHAYGFSLVAEYLAIMSGQETLPEHPALRGAAIRFLAPPEGKVRDVTGLDEARALPGILEVEVGLAPGDVSTGARSSTERSGHVLAVGADPAEADHRALAAVGTIAIEVEVEVEVEVEAGVEPSAEPGSVR